MKQTPKQMRQSYLLLNQMGIEICLCTWCKYATWERWGSECGESELLCQHPLEVVKEYGPETAWEGQGDCWGFRPWLAQEDAVDIVGMYLRGEYPDWDTVPALSRRKQEVKHENHGLLPTVEQITKTNFYNV